MRTILVVEDEKRIAKILKKGLTELGYRVALAYDGQEGLSMARTHLYDLVITDIMFPVMDGITFSRIIRKEFPNIPIIMLTALGTTDDKLEGFDAGADDYLVKPFDLRELNARINILLKLYANKREALDTELSYADLTLDLNKKIAIRQGEEIKLTPKEFNLLKYMLEHTETILTRAQIAKDVWNTHFDTGTNFIDVYINYLRNKIDKNYSTKLIHTRTGIGFILIKEE